MSHSSFIRKTRLSYVTALVFVAASVTSGCSDDDKSVSPGSSGSSGTPDASGPGSKIVINTLVTAQDGNRTTYIALADSLTTGPKLSLEGALEFPGRAFLFEADKPSAFFVLQLPTVKRYEVDDQNVIRETGSINFSAQGLTPTVGFGDYTFLRTFSPTKAYLFSNQRSKVVIFNPTTMTITGDFDISMQAESLPMRFSYPIGGGDDRPGQVVFGTWYADFDNESVLPVTNVVVLDTVNDAVVKITRDTRCGGAAHVVRDADGTVYFSPDVYAAAVHRLTPERGPKPCILRVLPGSNEPDPTYAPDTASFIDDATPTAGMMPSSPGFAYFYKLNEAEANITAQTTADELHGGPAWDWYKVDISKATPPVSVGLKGGTHFWWRMGEDVYLPEVHEGESTIIRASAAGAPEKGIVIPGIPRASLKVR